MGRKKTVRKAEVPFSFWFRNTASTRAMTTPKGTSIKAYLMVFQRDCQIAGSAKAF